MHSKESRVGYNMSSPKTTKLNFVHNAQKIEEIYLTELLPHRVVERVLIIKGKDWYTTMLRDHTTNEW